MLYPNTLDSLDQHTWYVDYSDNLREFGGWSIQGVPSGVIKHGLLEHTLFSSVTYNINKYHEMFNHLIHLILYIITCNIFSVMPWTSPFFKAMGRWRPFAQAEEVGSSAARNSPDAAVRSSRCGDAAGIGLGNMDWLASNMVDFMDFHGILMDFNGILMDGWIGLVEKISTGNHGF